MAKYKQKERVEQKGAPRRERVRHRCRKPARPTILVEMWTTPVIGSRMIELARELEWDLLEVHLRGYTFPPGIDPQGAIVQSVTGEFFDDLMNRGCPTVRIGRAPHPNDATVPAAIQDLRAAARMAAEHFADRGFRHVAYLGFDVDHAENFIQNLIYGGFSTRADELGSTCHLLSIKSGRLSPSETDPELYRRRQRWLAEQLGGIPRPVGLFAFSDGYAVAACCMCKDAGLAVPAEVAILGLGNDAPACLCSVPPISSVAPDHAGQADAAAHLLQQLMQGKPVPQAAVMIPPLGVVARESTNTIGTTDPRVGAAVRFMWDHLDLDLSVDDVAHEVGVARRTLEDAFRRHLGRGVNAELRRKRLEVFRDLLVSSDAPIASLAPRVGFGTMVHLQRSFRKAYGMSPRQFRAQEKGAAE